MFRKQKQILLLAIVFLSGTLLSGAQEPIKLSLQDAIKLAMQNNTNIQNSDLDLKIAQKKVWETVATGLPQISAKGTYQHVFKVPTLSFGGKTVLSNTEVPWDPNNPKRNDELARTSEWRKHLFEQRGWYSNRTWC